MSRNMYPEETYNKIIQVATRLFLEKGYEKTSLQDIISELGGLTKGAIYYHFKSKEDILMAVVSEICAGNSKQMQAIMLDHDLDGKHKLEKMFYCSIMNQNQNNVFSIVPQLLDNPTFLVIYIKMVCKVTVPDYIVPIIREGVEDGSIYTDKPDELADALMFLSDVWLNPLVFPMTASQIGRRACLLNQMMEPFNLTIFTDETICHLEKFESMVEK